MPELSICIPTYNGEQFIRETISSILSQTYRDFELVIVDDNSTDETVKIISEFDDPRIRLYRNQDQLGLVDNWNCCIGQSKGSLIQIFHQDDKMASQSAERVISQYHSNPDPGFLFSNLIEIDEHDQVNENTWNKDILPGKDTFFSGEVLFCSLISSGNWIPCSGVVVKADCYRRWGRFDQRLKYTPDLEMWLRLSLHTNSFFICEPLVYIRRHPDQETNRYLGKTQEVTEVWKAYQIVFTEQSQYITDIENKYFQALTFLRKWSKMQVRWRLRKFKVFEALQFLNLLWRLENNRDPYTLLS